MRYLLIIICLQIFSFLSAKDLVITKLSTSSIKIGNRTLHKGGTFSDNEVIYWSSPNQDMKAKPKSGGLPRHYSAAAFRSKSKKSLSIKQYLMYLNKTNHPSTLSSEMRLMEGRNKDKFQEKRLALVIGNSNYENLSPDLDCPISDAEDVSNKLNELGFDTFTLYDVDYMDFCNSLTNLNRVAKSDEYNVVLFYYCGHGNQYKGMNYLLPSSAQNTKPEHVDGWVSFDYVFETFEDLDTAICKTKLVFLDACRNTPGWETNSIGSRLDQYKTNGAFVVFSTENNSVALGTQEKDSRNTPFGASFLETVDKPSENITLTINELSESVKEKTEYYKNYGQNPRQVYTFGVGNVNFSFVPGVNIDALLNKTKYYLSIDKPEMAIANLDSIRPYLSFLTSSQLDYYKNFVQDINYYMLNSKIYLENISDTREIKNNDNINILRNNPNIKLEGDLFVDLIYNKNDTASIFIENTIVNRQKNLLLCYDYSHEKSIVIDLSSGNKIYDVEEDNYSYTPVMSYPVAMNNDASMIIYNVGDKYQETLWAYNAKNKSKKRLGKLYNGEDRNNYLGGFNMTDDYLFLYSKLNNLVTIFSGDSLNVIHTLVYEACDTIYWDDDNLLCVFYNNKIFKWQILENEEGIIINTPEDIIDIAISNDKKIIAAVLNDGSLMLFDRLSKEEKTIDSFQEYPGIIEFSRDNKYIWAISSFGSIKSFCLENMKSVTYETDFCNLLTSAFIYFTPDNKYCITSYGYYTGGDFRCFDTSTLEEESVDDILNKYFGFGIYNISDDFENLVHHHQDGVYQNVDFKFENRDIKIFNKNQNNVFISLMNNL